jgi:hypothetical protein
MKVIIGIDPHKASHTAVAVGSDEGELSRLRLQASRSQVEKLLAWAVCASCVPHRHSRDSRERSRPAA